MGRDFNDYQCHCTDEHTEFKKETGTNNLDPVYFKQPLEIATI